ncbi:hypothetical protein [Fibrivirga algicola]|uniref:Big-1 domain-containing protein n=1 Tax=Fibrivirga algicola TaxID=2950420 RepID=A0ABX0QSI3_9BACT|nr:hypothetical protein [Fibrivirga algicola]NID13503.1 hypothetical protein [Fibrivirga algicola]
MKTTYLTYLLTLSLLLLTCKPDELLTANLISEMTVSSSTVTADGASTVTVSAFLNPNIDSDKRTVVFQTTGGSYAEAKDGRTTKAAEFVDGRLVASVTLLAPIVASPTSLTVAAEMAYAELRRDYIARQVISVLPSLPEKLQLTANTLGALSGFRGDVVLTARLLNKDGRAPSRGTEVEFSDLMPNGTTSANGRFRTGNTLKTSDNTGQVIAYYSPGEFVAATDVILRATVKTVPTATDTLKLHVRLTD